MKKYRGIVIVGQTGSGKTTEVKKLLNSYPGNKIVYDVNKEYANGIFMDFDKFLPVVKEIQNSMIVFEEATIFFSNKGDTAEIRKMLIRKRHQNNVLIFCFHTMQQVPLNILVNCNLLILGKTNDNVELVRKKFKGNDNILTAFNLLTYYVDNPYQKLYVPL